MSIPTSQPIPDDDLPTGDQPGDGSFSQGAARRRRARRLTIPQGLEERAAFLDDLAYRVTPSFDYFLFSLVSGLIVGLALLLNAPALLLLAALVAPFVAPVIGLPLATVVGSGRFFLLSLAASILGSGMGFLGGAGAGYLTRYWPGLGDGLVSQFAAFNIWNFLLLTAGVVMTTISLARSDQKPGVPSVALAYVLYSTAGAAGYGLITNQTALWPNGLLTFGLYLAWSVFTGTLVLAVMGIKPFTRFGYVLGAAIALTSLIFLIALSGLGQVLRGQAPLSFPLAGQPTRAAPSVLPGGVATQSPSSIATQPVSGVATLEPTQAVTWTPTPTPTNTLIPSPTPTVTPTLAPTPVWAIINGGEFNGAYIRDEPSREGKIITSVLNGGLVQILPEIVKEGTVIWVHVRTPEGVEGWIVQSLLVTSTPAPNW